MILVAYRETIREAYVEGGLVRGIRAGNPVYTVFKGIPYAAPPVGPLRWKAPQPVVPWEGTRVCCEYGNIAGALTVSRPGAFISIPSHEDIRKFIRENDINFEI